ncbi:MAG: hypothetical protein IPN43_04490 [Chitinophagaceae bacterium]|nr:hypothetical protein [Chitinophagaceae bacterium]
MNITRHNYETFFLLYVDKELSAAERKAVDVFVQENPDLQMELALLQDTVMTADDIVLDKKDWLYMEEDITALQENLLLYVDEELNHADKKTIEAILATDIAAQKEWTVLHQTKLQPDMEVVFADKQSLYRKEPGRVVAFKWWRVAAAAVLLGFGIWTGVSVYKNSNTSKTGTEELANSKKNNSGQIQTDDTTGNTAITKQPDEKQAAENITSTTAEKNNEDQSTENIKSAVEKSNSQHVASPKENTTVQNNPNKKPDNNLPKPALQNINNSNSNEVTAQNVLPSNNNSSRVSGNNDAVVKITPRENRTVIENLNSKTDPDNITALQVVNTNKTADGEDNNRYLNVDDDKQKRTALGGFIRKAKRVLERNTNVKTGDGIKIAGFEIALK